MFSRLRSDIQCILDRDPAARTRWEVLTLYPGLHAVVLHRLAHWERSLVQIGFLDPAAPKKLMPRLQQLFNRAQPTPEEIHILRGIAKAMVDPHRPPPGGESTARVGDDDGP